MFIDSHAHLFFPNYNGDLDEVLNRARSSRIDYIIVPGTDLASSVRAVELADKYDFIYAATGIHPHDTKEWNDSLLKNIEEIATHKKVIAIGEIGLDYFYDFSPKETQLHAFRKQLDLAIHLNLPVIIHNREADEDMMNVIRSYQGSGLRAQFHCFAGTIVQAKELIEMHHYISFTGNITFTKADDLRNVLKQIQIDNLLLETDSPFMTPVPFRGKRNEPSYINFVAEKIAEVQHLTPEIVGRATSLNAFKLFGIGNKPGVSYTYELYNSLYINVTNRCNADCVFCDRKGEAFIKGYNLKMTKSEEPSADVYIKEIGDPKKYYEIVFCGYGEPTIRWDVVKEIAAYVKQHGGITRMNTDGHGNFINKRDITPEMKGLIDKVSISLNSVYPEQYAEIMRVKPELFNEMIDFARKAKLYSEVVMTVVGFNEIDTEKAKKFVEEEIGVSYRLRPYF